MDGWIRVEDGMPPGGSKVYVYKENGDFDICRTYSMADASGNLKIFFVNTTDACRITHWQIPTPPV